MSLFKFKKPVNLKSLIEKTLHELKIHFEYQDDTILRFSFLGPNDIRCDSILEIQESLNTFSVIVTYPKYVKEEFLANYLELFNVINTAIDSTFVIDFSKRTIMLKLNRFFNAQTYSVEELCTYFQSNFMLLTGLIAQSDIIEKGEKSHMEIISLIESNVSNG